MNNWKNVEMQENFRRETLYPDHDRILKQAKVKIVSMLSDKDYCANAFLQKMIFTSKQFTYA